MRGDIISECGSKRGPAPGACDCLSRWRICKDRGEKSYISQSVIVKLLLFAVLYYLMLFWNCYI